MARTLSATKRSLITDANSKIVIATAIAAFLVVFSLVACKALLGQASYQNRVISEKKKALSQLQSDLNARNSLVSSYRAFVGTTTNVLGGNPKGSGDKDGDNAKIVLDALPSKYDFPALATSLEKILTNQNYKIESIVGSDDEVNQQANSASSTPAPVDMPFQITVSTSYSSLQTLLSTLEKSIRPIQIQSMDLSGSDATMQISITAKTFYQPEKSLTISQKVVK